MATVNFRPPADRSLAQTIGRNTAFGVVARVAQVSTRLVTVPIVIAHLGLGGYGIWSIIMTTAAYMRFGSIGVKSAFQKYVAEATGNRDFETANKLLSTGCAIMLAVSIAGLIPIAFFSRELARLAGVPSEFLVSAARSFTMLAIIMVIANVGAVYEAIVMGGHRVDLARNFSTVFTVAEAVAIVILLHFGAGLFAMASVMAASEVGFIASCYVASKNVVPQIRLSLNHVTKSVVRELVRFGGSYQLANVLQVLYMSIVPLTVLRLFGANAAGIYALTIRLVGSALMLPDALIVPILSGAAMVFASGSATEKRMLINKSFKVTLALGLFPLVFTAIFGPMIVFAWTGEGTSSLRIAFWLVCAAGLFQSFSTLGLVLYRASGRVLLDNVRQVFQILILLCIAAAGHRLGFYGVLAGLAFVEFFGMIFMLFALTKAFDAFRAESLVTDAVRLAAAIAIVLCAAGLALLLPFPAVSTPRLAATVQLAKISFVCLIVAWPALALTKSVTPTESRAIISAFLPRKVRSQFAEEQGK
jgi:O-antigen/teichoic acid export membrane protein